MALSTLVLIIVFLINVVLLIYIAFNRKKRCCQSLFLMILLLAIWQGLEILSVVFFINDPVMLIYLVRGGLLPTLFLAPAFVWLVYSIFDKWSELDYWKKVLLWSPAIVMSSFVFSDYNLTLIKIENQTISYTSGPLYYFFAFYFALLMTHGLYFLIKNRFKAGLVIKKQIDHIFVGTGLAALFSLLFSVVLPLFGAHQFYYIGVNSSALFALLTTYALFRYRFFDIQISFFRAFIDLIRLFVTGSVFSILYFILLNSVKIDFSETMNIFYFLVFIGLTAPFIFRLVNEVVSSFLIDPVGDIQKSEDKIADILQSSRDLSILLTRLSKEIDKVIDFKEIFFYLSKKGNSDVFYQVFPAGERLIFAKDSQLINFFKKERQMAISAEIDYINKDDLLQKELKNKQIDISLPIFYNQQLLGFVLIDNDNRLLSIQQLNFLQHINKYLDIAVGSLLLHQQDLVRE